MKKILICFLILISFWACKKDLSPIGQDLSITFTKYVENEMYEFEVANNLLEPAQYYGYSEESPIFLRSVMSDTGWVMKGLGWCGTGLYKISLNPSQSIHIKVPKPEEYDTWRVGIQFYFESDEEGHIIWSEAL